MAQHDYIVQYKKGGKQYKTRITRNDGKLDCPGCGGQFKFSCGCGAKAVVMRAQQELYKSRC